VSSSDPGRLVGVRGHRDRRRGGLGVGRPLLAVGEHAADERGLVVCLHGGSFAGS
jgi:hypothetical protein